MTRTTLLLLALATAACATTKRPASLAQAESIYQRLEASGADRRVEGQLFRTKQAIDVANRAVDEGGSQGYVDDLGHIALRHAQTAEAEDTRLLAVHETDSLKAARLSTLLSLSESQRSALMQAQALSQEEIAALRERNMLTEQRADSLRQVAEEATARLNEALNRLRTLVVEITNLRETSRGLVISLSDILFDVDKATLKAGAEQKIQQIATILDQYPDYKISVEGHTDATGTDSYNQLLSEQRAAAVREALVRGGVEPGRITSQGLGETQPVADNTSAAGRQQNRRVEVIVLGAGTLAGTPGGDGGTPPR